MFKYRLYSEIKGGDVGLISLPELYQRGLIRGRYLESNWISNLPRNKDAFDRDDSSLKITTEYKFPLHIKSRKIMVIHVKQFTKRQVDDGDDYLDYIKMNSYSVDDNTSMPVSHSQVRSTRSFPVTSPSGRVIFIAWSYDLVTFDVGSKTNSDGVPALYKINAKLTQSNTIGGTYDPFVMDNLEWIRFIEVQPGFDTSESVQPTIGNVIPEHFHLGFYYMVNNGFAGVDETMVGPRYMNYLIPDTGVNPATSYKRISIERYSSQNLFLYDAISALDSKINAEDDTYSNAQITPKFDMRLTTTGEYPVSSYNELVDIKYPNTYFNGADLVYDMDLSSGIKSNIEIINYNSGTYDVLNIAFSNQFSGFNESATNELMEFYRAFYNVTPNTTIPLCNSFASLMVNTLSLPFWRRNEDCVYAGNDRTKTLIGKTPFSMVMDPRASVNTDEYDTDIDIYDNTNKVFIKFY